MNRMICFLLGCFFIASLESCEAIAGIFKAGVWTGILLVVAIVGLVIWLIARAGKK